MHSILLHIIISSAIDIVTTSKHMPSNGYCHEEYKSQFAGQQLCMSLCGEREKALGESLLTSACRQHTFGEYRPAQETLKCT